MGDILGIHHVTAICGPAQENLDFYVGVLGLRLVKLTVNFDDPSAYHLYYGDAVGSPGTILTFFPYPEGHPGRPGAGQASTVHLSVPYGSVPFWIDRFTAHEIDFDRPQTIDGAERLRFRAPDGLQLELVARRCHAAAVYWEGSPVPKQNAIGRIECVTLVERKLGSTKSLLEDQLGYRPVGQTNGKQAFHLGDGGPESVLYVKEDPTGPSGRQGRGGIHHIAFRIANGEAQVDSRLELVKAGLNVSAVMDRKYFRSIYFREPGGVLFEIATDPPGFTVDEAPDSLGHSLKLPPQYELFRGRIERTLPSLRLPTFLI